MTDRNTSRIYTARGIFEGEDWAGVAVAVNERMAALRIGQQELADRSGVSVSTVRQVQHGAGRRVQNRTLAALCRGLDWPEDHLSGLLRSGPRSGPAGTDHEPPSGALVEVLERVERALTEVSARLSALERAVHADGDERRPGPSSR
jgi:DNA-binding Xre family transcriptional regulator